MESRDYDTGNSGTVKLYWNQTSQSVVACFLGFVFFLNQLNLLMHKHFSLAEYWNEMFWHNQFKMFDAFQLVNFNIVKCILPKLERFTGGINASICCALL